MSAVFYKTFTEDYIFATFKRCLINILLWRSASSAGSVRWPFCERGGSVVQIFFQPRPVLLSQDELDAPVGPAETRVLFIILKRVTVIVGDLFPLSDVPQGDDPNLAAHDFGFGVGGTGMVDVAGGVERYVAVNVVSLVQVKKKHPGHGRVLPVTAQAGIAPFFRFGLGDLFPGVLDDPGPCRNIFPGKYPAAMNGRLSADDVSVACFCHVS